MYLKYHVWICVFHYPLTSARYKIEKCSWNWTDGDDERVKLNERGWLTTRHRNWLFFRPFHNKNPSIFITIFKNRIFVVLHKQKPSFFGVIFWSAGPGRAGSGRVAFRPKCEKNAFRFEPKTLIKPSIYQLSKWSNKPFKVHFSIWFQSALFNLI